MTKKSLKIEAELDTIHSDDILEQFIRREIELSGLSKVLGFQVHSVEIEKL